MSDPQFLLCPDCEHVEQTTELVPCPDCGSERTYRNHVPAFPDAAVEAYVKRDPDEALLD